MSLGVCPKNCGVASKASNLLSEASKPSAGTGWHRLAIGQPTSASYLNCLFIVLIFIEL